MSSHVSNAFASEVSAFFRSAGRSWTTPPEISFSLRASLISLSPRSHSGLSTWPSQTRTALGLKADDLLMACERRFDPFEMSMNQGPAEADAVHFYNTRDLHAYKVTSGHCPEGTTERVELGSPMQTVRQTHRFQAQRCICRISPDCHARCKLHRRANVGDAIRRMKK